MTSSTDWISAVCALIASFISIITLLTVFAAARQLLQERRIYQLGLSEQSLGPWHAKVETKQLLGLQRHIHTPIISLPALVAQQWKPNFTFPVVFTDRNDPTHVDPEMALAKASWVNFVQALGVSPQDEELYQMSVQSELVNGIIPMRWKGKDLVAICSMLGFQSFEDKPSFKSPLLLPMQWSGPLGWLQLRASSDGCVVEFRRRGIEKHQLPDSVHKFYKTKHQKDHSDALKVRLWQSISGLYMLDGSSLFISGADGPARQFHELRQQLNCSVDEMEELMNCHRDVLDKIDAEMAARNADEYLFDNLMTEDLTEGEILKRLNGETQVDSETCSINNTADLEKIMDSLPENIPNKGTLKGKLDALPEKLRDMLNQKKREVLQPCPGLLSGVVEGELAHSRGLDVGNCQEYHREYVDSSDIDRKAYPYNCGKLIMGGELLEFLKEALTLLKPDGFYFSPTAYLFSDIMEVFSHVQSRSYRLDHIFPEGNLEQRLEGCKSKRELYHAMLLCNHIQKVRKTSRAAYTVDDMVVVSKASSSLQDIVGPAGSDLVWAMLVCPAFFRDLAQYVAEEDVQMPSLLGAKVAFKNGELDCTDLMTSKETSGHSGQRACIYKVPFCTDGEFGGTQVLAAFADVWLTFFWISKKWISDVCMYDNTIPQTITMC